MSHVPRINNSEPELHEYRQFLVSMTMEMLQAAAFHGRDRALEKQGYSSTEIRKLGEGMQHHVRFHPLTMHEPMYSWYQSRVREGVIHIDSDPKREGSSMK